jgi:multiple sugar transport system permease protein
MSAQQVQVTEPAPARARISMIDRLRGRDPAVAPWLFLAPFLLLFAVFGVYPIAFSFYMSLHDWDPVQGLASARFVGLDNYLFVLADEWFHQSLISTAWLALASGVPQHLVAIPLACFIDSRLRRTRDWVAALYFLPYVTSTVAIAIMFTALLSRDFGMVNLMLESIAGLPVLGALMPAGPIDWLNDPDRIRPAVSMVVFWRFVGFNTLLYLAALQGIPRELYEAARLDGASAWQRFRHVTLPMLRPVAFFAVTLSIIGGMQLFEEPFVLSGGRGGPDQAVMTTAIYLYRSAFEFSDFGAASAMSWILVLLMALLSALVTRWLGNRGDR